MPRRYRPLLGYVLLLCTLRVDAALPNYVERSLDKQIVREGGRTYTVGPGRYVHKIPRAREERTRCRRDRYMSDKADPVWDCRWDNGQ